MIPSEFIEDKVEFDYKRKYQKLKKIGEGTYAVVYLGKDVDKNEFVAIKKIKLLSGASGLDLSAIREIKSLKYLRHQNIIHLIDVFTLKSNIHLILEYSKWNLELLIKEKNIVFMPADIKSWMLMLLKAIDFCHQHWILHRVFLMITQVNLLLFFVFSHINDTLIIHFILFFVI